MLQWVQSRKWLPEIYFTLGSLLLFSVPDYFARGLNGLLVSIALSLTLLLPRIQPLAIIPVVLGASYAASFFAIGPLFGSIASLIAVYAVAVFSLQLWVRFAVLASVAIGIEARMIGMIQSGQIQFNANNQISNGQPTAYVISGIAVVSMVSAVYLLGRVSAASPVRPGSAATVAKLENSVVDANLQIADLNKRLDISSDISELIVQNLSAVISRAEGGIYAAKANPDSAIRSLERVLENAQAANREVRRLIDLLSRRQEVSTAPPGLSDIDLLVVRYREQGFDVRYLHEGTEVPLNRGSQLAIYRIVFDALQFLTSQAAPNSSLSVDFVWSENGLQVLVKDDSISTENRANLTAEDADIEYTAGDDLQALVEPLNNTTIVACRERAELYGGTAELKLVPGVGYTFSIFFPELRLISAELES